MAAWRPEPARARGRSIVCTPMYRLQTHVFIMSGTIQAHVCVLGVLLQTFNFIIRSNGSPEKHTCGEECVRVLGFISVGAAKSSVQTCPSSRTKGLGRSAPMGLLFERYKYPRGFPERVGALSSLQLYTRSNGSPEKHTCGKDCKAVACTPFVRRAKHRLHTHVSFANPCVHHVRDNPSACVFLGSSVADLQLYTRSNGSPEKHTRGEEERSASSELTSDRTSDCVASLRRHPELGSGPGSHSAKSRQLGSRLQVRPAPPLGPELLQ